MIIFICKQKTSFRELVTRTKPIKKMNINEPKKPKNDIIVTCANCENKFIFAPRCSFCGQLIDYNINKLFYINFNK